MSTVATEDITALQHQQTTHLASPNIHEKNGESPRPVGDALEQHCRLVEGTT